jgi:NarL family two-component system response regulator LiaR
MILTKDTRHILFYGLALAVLVFILKWLQWKFLITDHSMEIYIGLVAVFFTALGIWVATQLVRPKIVHIEVEKEVLVPLPEDVTINEAELRKLNLTEREYEVLQLIVKGHSNADIAEHLFLSVSTVKTHVSNLFVKMNVKNRTQAMEKAGRLKLTA